MLKECRHVYRLGGGHPAEDSKGLGTCYMGLVEVIAITPIINQCYHSLLQIAGVQGPPHKYEKARHCQTDSLVQYFSQEPGQRSMEIGSS